MKYLSAILVCAMLAVPADAALFGRGRSMGNRANGQCQSCKNGQCQTGVNVNVGKKANVAVKANGDKKNGGKLDNLKKNETSAEQLADVLTRFDDLAVQGQYQPFQPQPAVAPPVAAIPPPAVDNTKLDELTNLVKQMQKERDDLKKEIDAIKNQKPETPAVPTAPPWSPPAKPSTPAPSETSAPPAPAKVFYNIERKKK